MCPGPLRVSMKTKDTICIICGLCSGKSTIINQRSGGCFWWWDIKGSFSVSPNVLLKRVWDVYFFDSTIFLMLRSESQAFLSKGPPFRPQMLKTHINLLSIRHTFDFYPRLETLSELSYCSIQSQSFKLL